MVVLIETKTALSTCYTDKLKYRSDCTGGLAMVHNEKLNNRFNVVLAGIMHRESGQAVYE